MFKYIFCIVFFLGSVGVSVAQSVQDTLLVVPGKENLYFYHAVTKGETLYGLSRKYHLEPKTLAEANHITLKTPLKLFQLLKIPLNQNNFFQSENIATAELTPLYHKVIKGETLYRVSRMHNKVNPGLLKKWNHLKNNEVKSGQYLIVGWLKTGNENAEDALAENSISKETVAQKETTQPDQYPTVSKNDTAEKQEIAAQVNAAKTPKAAPAPVPQTTAASSANNTGGGSFLSEVIAAEHRDRGGGSSNETVANVESVSVKSKAEEMKPAPVEKNVAKEDKPAKEPEVQPVKEKKQPAKNAQPEEENPFSKMLDKVTHKPQPAASKTAPADNVLTPAIAPESKVDSPHLVTAVKSEFEQQFEQQTDSGANIDVKKGAAGWFRSNVKPGSGRYYALCDALPRGTIVKVINPISGKYVLAKVLDAIPKQKENYNLIIKLSDAAMEDLGISQSRFWCEIRYAKDK